jgi:hypothetical protein
MIAEKTIACLITALLFVAGLPLVGAQDEGERKKKIKLPPTDKW